MLKFSNGDTIVFAGDSTTDSGRKRPVGEGLWDGVGNGYVRTIDTMLNVYYPEQFFHIINAGVGGNTSSDLRARWQTDVLDQKPDWVSLMIGINDVWRQFDEPGLCNQHILPEKYEENLRAMIEATRPQVKGMILMTPYYMEPNAQDLMRARTDEYGAVVKRLAEEYGLPCIDLQQEFLRYLQYRHSSYIMWDRVHPGWIGSMIIARAFLREVGFDRPVI